MSKKDDIIAEFFQGDEQDFIDGVFDGALSGTLDWNHDVFDAQPYDYRVAYHYGKVVLVHENPTLFSRILTSGEDFTVPGVVTDVDLLRGVSFDEEKPVVETCRRHRLPDDEGGECPACRDEYEEATWD